MYGSTPPGVKSVSRKMGVGGPMTICMLTKDADVCCILCLSEWSVSLLFPWFKDNLTKANQYLVFWQDDLLGTAVTQNVNYFDLIKYFKDLSHRNVENVREEQLFYLVCFILFNLYESIILSCEFFWHSEGKISIYFASPVTLRCKSPFIWQILMEAKMSPWFLSRSVSFWVPLTTKIF